MLHLNKDLLLKWQVRLLLKFAFEQALVAYFGISRWANPGTDEPYTFIQNCVWISPVSCPASGGKCKFVMDYLVKGAPMQWPEGWRHGGMDSDRKSRKSTRRRLYKNATDGPDVHWEDHMPNSQLYAALPRVSVKIREQSKDEAC